MLYKENNYTLCICKNKISTIIELPKNTLIDDHRKITDFIISELH